MSENKDLIYCVLIVSHCVGVIVLISLLRLIVNRNTADVGLLYMAVFELREELEYFRVKNDRDVDSDSDLESTRLHGDKEDEK